MLTALALLLSGPAHAGCTKDTDCKGDRICDAGTCVDPATPAPAAPRASSRTPTPSRVDPQVLQSARSARGGAMTREISGWALIGTGAVFGIAGSAVGLAEAPWYVATPIGAVGLGGLAAAGPVAAGGGVVGRRALEQLGETPPGPGLPIAGWSCYGLGMLLGVTAVGLGFAEDSTGGAVGLVSVIPATTGAVLLTVDSARVRRRLDAKITALAATDGTNVEHVATRVTVAPYVAPTQGGGMAGVSGSF